MIENNGATPEPISLLSVHINRGRAHLSVLERERERLVGGRQGITPPDWTSRTPAWLKAMVKEAHDHQEGMWRREQLRLPGF